MLIKFLILFAIAAFAPRVFPGIKVKTMGTAAMIAVVFGVFNFLFGWLLGLAVGVLSLPLIIVSVGLFVLLIPTVVNAILLKLTDYLLEDFELAGWWPAIGMGLLFSLGGWLGNTLAG